MNDNILAQLEAVAYSGFEPFTTEGLTLHLRPVSVIETIRLVRKYPDMKSALYGFIAGAMSEEGYAPNPATLLTILVEAGPEALAAFVAISAGKGGNADVEAGLAALPDKQLIPIVSHVKEITMTEGILPFFALVTKTAALEKSRDQTEAVEKPATAKRIRKA